MRVVVDRPTDHQVWDRAEPIAGWVEGLRDAHGLRIVCAGVELPVGACLHPRGLDRRDVHGFWTELVVQRHLDAVRDGRLTLEVWRGDTRLAAVPLWISPFALELARTHPLDRAEYAVPAPATPAAPPRALVFPGLGAVGGSSLNRLMRTKMLHAGWATTVYDEANEPTLWERVRARRPRVAYRWVDGHGCWGALASDDDAVRVTLLRDPVRRLISIYDYGVLVHPEDFAGGTFDDFVASGAARHYSQAAGLLRAAGREPVKNDVALHRAAATALRTEYALVGITERFEETVLLTAGLAGYATIGAAYRVLAAPRSVQADQLSTATRRRLADDLAVDLELYEEARRCFDARAAAAGLGTALECYRAASARCRDLSPGAKAVECLRWRQVLSEHRVRPVGGVAAPWRAVV